MDSPLLPGTEAGMRLVLLRSKQNGVDLLDAAAMKVICRDILAIEAEAAAAALAGVRREVEALPYVFRQHTCWDDHEGPDAAHPHLDGSPCGDRISMDAVDRAAVLALLSPESRP